MDLKNYNLHMIKAVYTPGGINTEAGLSITD